MANFKERVKNSFKNFKDHMVDQDIRISVLESQIQGIQTKLNKLLAVQTTPTEIQTSPTAEFKGFRPSTDQIYQSSTGNQGVDAAEQQQSSSRAAAEQQQSSRAKIVQNQGNRIPSINEQIKELNQELLDKFSFLTDSQFKIFLSIYRLEEELNRSVLYSDISQDVNISEGAIRAYVKALFLKKIPLTKQILHKNKVGLSIDPEFKNLKLLQTLLSLREKGNYQTTLNTNFQRNSNF